MTSHSITPSPDSAITTQFVESFSFCSNLHKRKFTQSFSFCSNLHKRCVTGHRGQLDPTVIINDVAPRFFPCRPHKEALQFSDAVMHSKIEYLPKNRLLSTFSFIHTFSIHIYYSYMLCIYVIHIYY